MNIACPECQTVYRIDPDRVPGQGARTRCRNCATPFLILAGPGDTRPGAVAQGRPAPAPEPAAAPASEPETAAVRAPTGPAAATGVAPAFGPQDPDTRARRLARALVSDIKVYNPAKWRESLEAGSLRKEFRSEILKSWEEYVEQVGEEMAKGTPHFRAALNEILAEGKHVF